MQHEASARILPSRRSTRANSLLVPLSCSSLQYSPLIGETFSSPYSSCPNSPDPERVHYSFDMPRRSRSASILFDNAILPTVNEPLENDAVFLSPTTCEKPHPFKAMLPVGGKPGLTRTGSHISMCTIFEEGSSHSQNSESETIKPLFFHEAIPSKRAVSRQDAVSCVGMKGLAKLKNLSGIGDISEKQSTPCDKSPEATQNLSSPPMLLQRQEAARSVTGIPLVDNSSPESKEGLLPCKPKLKRVTIVREDTPLLLYSKKTENSGDVVPSHALDDSTTQTSTIHSTSKDTTGAIPNPNSLPSATPSQHRNKPRPLLTLRLNSIKPPSAPTARSIISPQSPIMDSFYLSKQNLPLCFDQPNSPLAKCVQNCASPRPKSVPNFTKHQFPLPLFEHHTSLSEFTPNKQLSTPLLGGHVRSFSDLTSSEKQDTHHLSALLSPQIHFKSATVEPVQFQRSICLRTGLETRSSGKSPLSRRDR